MKIETRQLKTGVVVTDVRGYSIVMRGSYTLAGGTVAVTFPRELSDTTDLVIICQSNTANIQYPSSPTVTGFTANGTGADTGKYLAIGNIKY